MKIDLILGNCLEKLEELPENSVDSIVTDPPYGLSFMDKDWDKGVPGVHFWQKMIRVLKPGGHLLAFGGTRTYHRMAVAIEDAGFEVRDMIEWVYGSGFPKSLNIGKSVNQLETDEWSKISKALDNIDQKSIMEVWKSNVKSAGIQLSKSLTEVGSNTPKNFFVPDIAVLYHKAEVPVAYAPVFIAELSSKGLTPLSEESGIIVQENADTNTILLQNRAKFAVKLSQSHEVKPFSIFTAQCDVKEWLNENTEVNHKVDEALKTLRGNKKYSNEEITNVLCVALTDILKLTILNQSKTFQNYDTKGKMDYASAINVIITEYTAENLISNTVAILKSKAVDKLQGNEREVVAGGQIASTLGSNTMDGGKANPDYKYTKGTSEWEGWGTALKPAHEPICMARKPLAEKTVAENVLKYGTGGINIDESRVGTEERFNAFAGNKDTGFTADDNRTDAGKGLYAGNKEGGTTVTGRFPANLLHDNSEEVRECFPDTKSNGEYKKTGDWENTGDGKIRTWDIGYDKLNKYAGQEGNASCFFKSIIYQAKASKSERNKGCEELEEKDARKFDGGDFINPNGKSKKDTVAKNNHPTVKPIALMEYLIKMVTPKGGTVLDSFMGSGSTGVACQRLGMDFIGIELVPEYFEIANARLKMKEILEVIK